MKLLLSVGIGGFLGSILRYTCYLGFNKIFETSFPIGTLIINLIGCFLIGLLINVNNTISINEISSHEFMIIGVLGGFTTFSAFGIETYMLIKKHLFITAFTYIFLSVFFGLLAIYISSKLNNNF